MVVWYTSVPILYPETKNMEQAGKVGHSFQYKQLVFIDIKLFIAPIPLSVPLPFAPPPLLHHSDPVPLLCQV